MGEWLPSPPARSRFGGKTNGFQINSYYVYILKSCSKDRFYIGHTANLEKRLSQHNSGKVKSTKAFVPWEIVYFEKFSSKSDAFRREMKIKSFKSGDAFKRLLNNYQTG